MTFEHLKPSHSGEISVFYYYSHFEGRAVKQRYGATTQNTIFTFKILTLSVYILTLNFQRLLLYTQITFVGSCKAAIWSYDLKYNFYSQNTHTSCVYFGIKFSEITPVYIARLFK